MLPIFLPAPGVLHVREQFVWALSSRMGQLSGVPENGGIETHSGTREL